eukprot:gene23744-23793_t
MQLGYTILYVADVPATLKFYEAAFGLTTRFLHDSGDYGELETGSTALAFSSHSLMRQLGKYPHAASPTAPCFEIALCTPDVAAALERAIAAGATPMRPLEVMPWGQTIAYVADINGFLRFYDALLGALGIKPGIHNHNGVVDRYFYRTPTGSFGITRPLNGEPATAGNGSTIGFTMASIEQADAFHAAGIAN